MSDQGPTVFNGRYELLRHIARGGMADVYLARDELLDREVALKVLFPEFANDPNFVERFRREAQAAANLNHPNIVGIYDWGQERGTYYIVMEHVSGRSMSDVLRSTGPLNPDRAAEIAADVAAALSTAHQAGIVHRDVKLGNILVSDSGDVKVADFGIATALAGGTDAGLTQHGSVMGTATYFSPEQAQGKQLDGRSDLYSLGVVLYEMLAGTPPFQAETPVAVAYKHVQEKPDALADRGVQVAKSLNAITMKLLAKNPANRYPTADDLRSDLRRYLAGAHQVPGGAAAAAAGAGAAAGAAAAAAAPSEPAPSTPDPATADATTVQPATPAAAVPAVVPSAQPAPGAPVDPNALAAQYAAGGYYYDDEPPERDDWKRTVALLLGLGVLIFILGYLTIAFGRELNIFGDDDDPADTDETAELVTVPSVVGEQSGDAIVTLRELGLEVIERPERNASVEVGEVFQQLPLNGQKVDEGTEIEIFVSTGEAQTVPTVIGMTQEEARIALEAQGYIVEPVSESNAQEVGLVFRQEPVPGTEHDLSVPVEIFVSTGPDRVVVPDLEGKTLLQASQLLSELGLEIEGEPIQEASLEIDETRIIRSEPASQSLVAVGTRVVLYQSSGTPTVPVPTVIGLFYDTAEATLRNVGLVPEIEFRVVPFGDPQVGLVIDQTPPNFEEVEVNTTVVVVVGEAGPEPTTTSTTTTTTSEAPDPDPNDDE
ncbi:MAG: Stk1 family PASTA domain-containing Ser/Thr kinase [Actinomycetota bacterium]